MNITDVFQIVLASVCAGFGVEIAKELSKWFFDKIHRAKQKILK